MNEILSQYLNGFALDLVSLGTAVLVYFGSRVLRKAQEYFESKTTESNRQMLQMIAQDAVLFVESVWQTLDGPAKFSQAVQHAVQVANHHGLNLNTQDVQAAIQSAFVQAKANGLIKPSTTPTQQQQENNQSAS